MRMEKPPFRKQDVWDDLDGIDDGWLAPNVKELIERVYELGWDHGWNEAESESYCDTQSTHDDRRSDEGYDPQVLKDAREYLRRVLESGREVAEAMLPLSVIRNVEDWVN